MTALSTLIGTVEGVLDGADVVRVVLDGVEAVPRLHGIDGLGVLLVLPLVARITYLALAHLV